MAATHSFFDIVDKIDRYVMLRRFEIVSSTKGLDLTPQFLLASPTTRTTQTGTPGS